MRNLKEKVFSCILASTLVVGNLTPYANNISVVKAEEIVDVKEQYGPYCSAIAGEYTCKGVTYGYDIYTLNSRYGEKLGEFITNLYVKKVALNVTEVDIPQKINEVPVVGILGNALKGIEGIISLKIPATVVRIGDNAFRGCDTLKTVDFEDCSKLEKVGNYMFQGCRNLENNNSINELLKYGKVSIGMFEDCSSLTDLEIDGTDVVIPDYAFQNCISLSNINIKENVKNLKIGKGAFFNAGFSNIIFNCDVTVSDNAFESNKYLSEVVFNSNVSLEECAFKDSFKEDVKVNKKSVRFSGIDSEVKIGSECFSGCTGLNDVIFDVGIKETVLSRYCFSDTNITNLEFSGGDVIAQDGSLANMSKLSNMVFNNTGTTDFVNQPFYSLEKSVNKQYNKLLTNITFNCKKAEYIERDYNATNSEKYDKFENTYKGLENLKSVTCGETCEKYSVRMDSYSGINSFYFKNPNVDISGILDRSDSTYTLYGYSNNVEKYVENIKNSSELWEYNKKIKYESIVNGLLVSYNGDNLVDGKDINVDDIYVYASYKDGTKSKRIEYSQNGNKFEGFIYTYNDYDLSGKENITASYLISYGDHSASIPVMVVAREIESFDINYIGNKAVEGTEVTNQDFSISNIKYNDGKIEETPTEAFSIDKEYKLKAGTNIINVTYKGKTLQYILEAQQKKIKNLSIELSNNATRLFEGGILSKDDFIVTAYYDNGEEVENFTDYILEDTIVKKGVTNVKFISGNYMQVYEYQGIALKVDHLNVSYNDKGVVENGFVNKADLEVKAVYNSGKEVMLREDEYSLKTYTIIGGKVNTVFVVYNDDAAVPIVPFNVTGIKLTSDEPNQTKIPDNVVPSVVPTEIVVTPIVTPTVTIPVITEVPITFVPAPSLEPMQSPETMQTLEPIQNVEPIPTQTVIVTQNTAAPVPVQTVNPDVLPNAVPITLEQSKYTVGVKEKITIKLASGIANSFTSSDKNIATVSAKGVVTARKTGSVNITIIDSSGNQKICTIVVKKAPKVVKASFTKKVLKVKKTVIVKPKFKKGDYSNKIVYTSSNKKVVTVSSKGVITAKKKGKAVITLKTYNGKKAKVFITVR